jgi:acyl dehydratase
MFANLLEGREFSGHRRELSMTRMLAFSGGPFGIAGWPARNLHTDTAKAAEAGLRAPIASGVQCEGDLIRLLTELFGEAWFRHGKLHVKYPRPVFAGMSVQPHARVRARRHGEGGTVVELDVWCEAPEKEIVLVGTASCLDSESPQS